MAAGDATATTRLAKPSPSVVKATEADDGSGHAPAGDMGAVSDCKGTMAASRVGDGEGNVMEMNGSSADFVA